MQLNTYEVHSRVTRNLSSGLITHLTSDRVIAKTKEEAAAKIEAREGHKVSSVIFVGRWN